MQVILQGNVVPVIYWELYHSTVAGVDNPASLTPYLDGATQVCGTNYSGWLTYNTPALAASGEVFVYMHMYTTAVISSDINTAAKVRNGCPGLVCPTITAALSGGGAICPGGSSTITATITNGTGPYSLTLSDGTVVDPYTSGTPISLSPASTTTYTITSLSDADGCSGTGSGSATITVGDNTPPSVSCPASITDVVLNGSGNGTLPANVGGSGTDNCGTPTITSPSQNYTCADVGSQSVTVTATDASGNTATVSCNFNVVDNAPPTVSCPASIADVVLNGSGNGTLPANVGGSGTDNCGTPTITSPSQSHTCADIGSQSVTLTATDASGNTASISCTYNVVDNTPPDATCQDITVEIGPIGVEIVTAADIDDGSSDNCGIVSRTINGFADIGLSCTNVGAANTGLLTVTDASGNTSTCLSNIDVQDKLRPGIACPANDAQNVSPLTCLLDYVVPLPTSNDNCGVVTTEFRYRETYFSGAPKGSWSAWAGTSLVNRTLSPGEGYYEIRWRVFDAAGNHRACSYRLDVGATPPVITNCPSGGFVNCAADIPAIAASDITYTPAILPLSAVTINGPVINGLPDAHGTTYTYIYTLTDGCGYFTTCTRVFTINRPTIILSSAGNICAGDDVTLSAIVGGGTGICGYQWERQIGPNWVPVPGNDNQPTLQINNLLNNRSYRIRYGCLGSACGPFYSNVINVNAIYSSVGDRVWDDLDHDGIQDPGEPGLAGVTVQLYNCSTGGLVGTQVTGGSGNYNFIGVLPGEDYYLQFSTVPHGYNFSGINQTMDDEKDSDVIPATGRTLCFTLGCFENLTNWDAGLFRYSYLKGFVWDDFDEDGDQDAETGIQGVRAIVRDVNNTVVFQGLSNALGEYGIVTLWPGTFTIQMVQIPAGYVLSPANATNDKYDSDFVTLTETITILPGDTACMDLGLYQPQAKVGGTVWDDVDMDGLLELNENGIQHFIVKLYNAAGGFVTSTTTGVDGKWEIDNLEPGNYRVKFENYPIDFVQSPDGVGFNEAVDSDAEAGGWTAWFNLAPAACDLTWNAGIYLPLGSLGNKVWEDINENGIQDAGEPPISGVRVVLYNGAGVRLDSVNTNLAGMYLFENLLPGSYCIRLKMTPPNYVFSPKDATTNDVDSDIDPTTGKSEIVALAAGEDYEDLDAGLYVPLASLGDRVWDDVNENGAQDIGEQGIPGVKVILLDGAGNKIDSIYTNATGNYDFDRLRPGNYRLCFELPAYYLFSPKDQVADNADSDVNSGNSKTDLINLSAGENEDDVDAGMYLPKGSVAGKVWEDDDKDGERDSGENGVSGVRVVLYNCAGDSIDQTFTDINGVYSFDDVISGSYYVSFKDLPAGYGFGPKDAATDNVDSDANQGGQTDCMTVGPGQAVDNVDGGIIPPSAELNGKLWDDINEDGLRGPQEPGMPNILVTLYDCTGNQVAQTSTDANGNYVFNGLQAGDYYVIFGNLPTGYNFTSQDEGMDDTVDSDANGSGQTACTNLAAGQVKNAEDGGISPDRIRVCDASDFDPTGHGLLFTSGTYPGTDNRYAFDSNGGEFITYANGTARLTGIMANKSNANMKFCVELRLINHKDWGNWSAQGGLAKGAQLGPFMTWEFYEVDSIHSRLIGKDNLAGEVLALSHMPVSRVYGPQVGDGANDRNTNYGMSGWWFFNSISGNSNYSGTGDFNLNLDNCQNVLPPIAPRLGGLALLQGPYDASTGEMRTDLSSQNLLPASQPFGAAPWSYLGTESIGTQAPVNAVDWVLVELRDVTDPTITLGRQAGLLLKDGQIVQADGHSLMEIPQGASSFYLVIHNWNHLPVMSSQPLQKYGNVYYHDFTNGLNGIYSDVNAASQPAALTTGGITLLYEGDATGDALINSLDLGSVMRNYFGTGSNTSDVNLDGVINSLDVGRAMGNYFKTSHIPR